MHAHTTHKKGRDEKNDQQQKKYRTKKITQRIQKNHVLLRLIRIISL